MSLTLDISEIAGDFPAYRVALVRADGLAIEPGRPPGVAALVAEVEREVLARWGEAQPSEIPEVAAWRDAYKDFGIRKTSYRPSVERLLRAIQKGRGLPEVNAFVDSYNAISARFRMPAGADDLDRIRPPLAFRYSRPDDSFIALGDAARREDPPKDGEVVFADAAGTVLCRRWNWYQDARSAITPETRSAVVTVQSLAPAPAVEEAAEALCAALGEHCAAQTAWAVADAGAPVASVP